MTGIAIPPGARAGWAYTLNSPLNLHTTMRSASPTLYVFSGAGLSAESQIATFRDKGGIWSKNSIERVCHIDTWQANRDEVYDFYEQRRAEMLDKAPNVAHALLAKWQLKWGKERVRLLTQNVDLLLEEAGAPDVVHLHGRINDLLCTHCNLYFEVTPERFGRHTACPRCGLIESVKPGVVFFGEHAPQYSHLSDMREALRPQDIVIVVGTSLLVLAPHQFLPPRRYDCLRNWQVNPAPDMPEWFGVNQKATASVGLQDLEPLLFELMDVTGDDAVRKSVDQDHATLARYALPAPNIDGEETQSPLATLDNSPPQTLPAKWASLLRAVFGGNGH